MIDEKGTIEMQTRARAVLFVLVIASLTLFFACQKDIIQKEAAAYKSESLGISSTEAYFRFTDIPDGGDTFVFKLTNPDKIQLARNILSGIETREIHPMGVIFKPSVDYNPPWSFHLDPTSVEFFSNAIEVCDGTIQYVEDHFDEFCSSFEPGNCQWCPWNSKLLEEIQYNSREVHLFSGWNKISLPEVDQYSASSVLEDIDSDCGQGTAEAASRFRWGWWESFVSGYDGVDFTLYPNTPFYVRTSQSCVWRP